MKKFRYNNTLWRVCFLCCLLTVSLFSKAQSDEIYLKNGWGINVESNILAHRWKIVRDGGHNTNTPDGKLFSIGANANYTWHPFRPGAFFSQRFFMRFSLGGEYMECQEDHDELLFRNFMFDTKVLLGYSLIIKNMCFNIFTGPTGRFIPYKNHKKSRPYHSSESYYIGSADWTFGLEARFRNWGVNFAYKQPMTCLIRQYRTLLSNGESFRSENHETFNSFVFGASYYF